MEVAIFNELGWGKHENNVLSGEIERPHYFIDKR